MLAAGPGAQLVLLGLVMLTLGSGVLGITWRDQWEVALQNLRLSDRPIGIAPRFSMSQGTLGTALSAYDYLFYINFLWPLLNLLPIWPLDGGQMLHVMMTRVQGRPGARRAHVVSMVTAGLLAGWLLSKMQGGGKRASSSSCSSAGSC